MTMPLFVGRKRNIASGFVVRRPVMSSDPKGPEVRPRCPKCHQEIDPDVCWCGDMMEPSSHGDHYAIPMGCRCHFARGITR